MYVHNYVPDPLEVPNNVSEERYALRLKFIRKVSLFHGLSVLAIAAISQLRVPVFPPLQALSGLAALLLVLCLSVYSCLVTSLLSFLDTHSVKGGC